MALERVFEVVDRDWRGLGTIPRSGLGLRPAFRVFDADARFPRVAPTPVEPPDCRSGLVLAGRLKPDACPLFGTACTPDHPKGATMVSTEGVCAAYYRYRRRQALVALGT